MSAFIHQRILLHDKGLTTQEKYASLPEKVTKILPIQQLYDARRYNRGINLFDMLFCMAYATFDFILILLDVPSFFWHGWLKILKTDEHCGQEVT